MSYTPRRMDPDEDGTSWRSVITYKTKPLDDFFEGPYTEVFGPYKTEPTAVGMISRFKRRTDVVVLAAHIESTDTHWKVVEEF